MMPVPRHLTVIAALLLISACGAVAGADILVVSTRDDMYCPCASAAAFQTRDVHALILSPSRPVAAVSFGVEIVTDVTYFGHFAASEGWMDEGDGGTLRLVNEGGPLDGDIVMLARIPFTPIATSDSIEFYLRYPDDEEAFFYTDADGHAVPLTPIHPVTIPSVILNPGWECWNCNPPATSPMTWSAVKALYR